MFFSLTVAFIAAEIGLRIVGYESPVILTAAVRDTYQVRRGGAFVYRGYLEGMFSDFATPVKMNRLGFHDVDHAAERAAPDTYRLMIVGDSYVAALSCPLDQTFHRRLEGKLKADSPFGRSDYEVIALGRSAQAQEVETKDVERFGPVFRPDAVLLLFFCGNDFMENSPETYGPARTFAARHRRVVAPRKLAFFNTVHVVRSSRLNGLFAEAATSFYANHLHWFIDGLEKEDLISPELGVYRVPLAPEWQRAYDRTADLLALLKKEVGKLGVPLLIAGLSGPQAIGDVGRNQLLSGGGAGFDPRQPERWLADWCRANGVAYVSLEPALAAAGKRAVFWPHDGHLNLLGNEVIVDPLYRLVAAHPPHAEARKETGLKSESGR